MTWMWRDIGDIYMDNFLNCILIGLSLFMLFAFIQIIWRFRWHHHLPPGLRHGCQWMLGVGEGFSGLIGGCVPPLVSCCSLWLISHWVQGTVNCLCLVFRWQAYPIRNMVWLLYPGSLADLSSALTGSADSLRRGVYHLYYRLRFPLLIPGGQANSSLLLINNSFDSLKGCWGNFLGSSMFCGYQRLEVSCQGLSSYPFPTDHYAHLVVTTSSWWGTSSGCPPQGFQAGRRAYILLTFPQNYLVSVAPCEGSSPSQRHHFLLYLLFLLQAF